MDTGTQPRLCFLSQQERSPTALLAQRDLLPWIRLGIGFWRRPLAETVYRMGRDDGCAEEKDFGRGDCGESKWEAEVEAVGGRWDLE